MSKYMVNKFIRAVELSDVALEKYIADKESFIQDWLASGQGAETVSDDRELTAEEHAAFASCDYGELYRLGAHPYLLWHFIEAVFTGDFNEEFGWRDLVEKYRGAIAPYGFIDYIP